MLLPSLSMVFDGSGPLVKRCDGFDGSLWSISKYISFYWVLMIMNKKWSIILYSTNAHRPICSPDRLLILPFHKRGQSSFDKVASSLWFDFCTVTKFQGKWILTKSKETSPPPLFWKLPLTKLKMFLAKWTKRAELSAKKLKLTGLTWKQWVAADIVTRAPKVWQHTK